MLIVKKKLNTPQPTAPMMQEMSPGSSEMNQMAINPAYNIQPGSLNLLSNPYHVCYSNVNEMKQLNV